LEVLDGNLAITMDHHDATVTRSQRRWLGVLGVPWGLGESSAPVPSSSVEAIIPGTGSILHDGAEVSGKVKNFNQAGNPGDPWSLRHPLANCGFKKHDQK